MMRKLASILSLCLAILLTISFVGAQDDSDLQEMDKIASGPVVETPREKQVEIVLPSEQIEVGIPFSLRLKVLVSGDFETLILKQDKFGEAYLIGDEFRPVGNNEFVASYRIRKSGTHKFSPEVFGKVAGSTELIRLSADPFEMTVRDPVHEASSNFRQFTDVRLIPFDYTWRNVVLTVAGIVLLIVLIVAGLLLRAWLNRRALIVPPVSVRPPIELALEEVKLLSSLEKFLIEGSDAHYTALSLALRRYLERQFGIPAAEMTEDEVIDFVQRNLDTANQAGALNQVFSRSSLAKFARQPISREIAGEDCEASLKFLQREQTRLEAVEAARRAREAQSDRSAA